jgi:hypothetical protein
MMENHPPEINAANEQGVRPLNCLENGMGVLLCRDTRAIESSATPARAALVRRRPEPWGPLMGGFPTSPQSHPLCATEAASFTSVAFSARSHNSNRTASTARVRQGVLPMTARNRHWLSSDPGGRVVRAAYAPDGHRFRAGIDVLTTTEPDPDLATAGELAADVAARSNELRGAARAAADASRAPATRTRLRRRLARRESVNRL